VRFLAALLSWLITTAMLTVAVPTAWAQRNLVDVNGYAALAQRAASDPTLRSAVAAELTMKALRLIRENGYDVDASLVSDVADSFTAGPSFPPQLAQASRAAHRWLFVGDDSASWVINVAPMLDDKAFQELLSSYHVQPPATVTVPVTVSPPDGLRPGRLQPVATWARWVSLGVSVITGIFALLTLVAARRRGKALTGLGVSALLVGALGWAGIEVARRYLGDALNRTTGNIRQIADVMVDFAEASLHQWLNLTLAAGGVLVVFGVIVAMLGGLRRKDVVSAQR
jgi:hypothetical protein